MTTAYEHEAVLFAETIDNLVTDTDGVYIDGTFGRGGHSQGILDRLTDAGQLIAIDKDPSAIKHARATIDDSRFVIEQGSFAEIGDIAAKHNVTGKVTGILLDLGVSSPQLDDAERGFSFLRDGPLDMRMASGQGMSASDWVNSADEHAIVTVLKDYGEERYAKRIARAIVTARDEAPITRTKVLADIIAEAHPAWEKGKHPATQSFQAIRIFINNELGDLKDFLSQCLDVLAVGGHLAIISFHSLEDRLVKRFIRDEAKGDNFPKDLPVSMEALSPRLRARSKSIRASAAEVSVNPRARSAVLRIAEKIA
ncbi:MAG: hypothetical protein CMF50_10085 [Legionellales bacterium]|nr:hypothetical protein [Legionellales bacterium]